MCRQTSAPRIDEPQKNGVRLLATAPLTGRMYELFCILVVSPTGAGNRPGYTVRFTKIIGPVP